MHDVDLIFIAQSEVVNYAQYSNLPLDRLELYRELVYPRMVYYQGSFRSHVDLLNMLLYGLSFQDASPDQRRKLLSIWNLPSLSGMHIANYLWTHGFRTFIVNNFDAELDRFAEIYSNCSRPPLVGISSTFHLSYSELLRLTRSLRTFDTNMDIAVGGAFINGEVNNNGIESLEKHMRRCGIDYAVHSFNSEVDLRNLLHERKQGGDVSRVTNLAYFGASSQQKQFRHTELRWNPPVLDETPGTWDELELPFVNRTVQMRTSSGCPFQCAFCSYPQVARGFQTMAVETVERSLQSLLRVPHVDRVVFIDDTFNVPPGRFKEMCRVFAKYDFQWYSFLRVQFVDDETVKLMRESGCKAVYLGIESANDVVLRNMSKKATRSKFERGVELLRKHGIASVAAFVLGFPGETEQTIMDDVDFIESTGIDYFTLKEFYYMEHTPVHRDRAKYNLTGSGNKWSHGTMDSRTAYDYKMQMFRQVRNSTFIDPDTSLWYLVLLQERGFSFPEITLLQKEINRVMLDQAGGIFDDEHPAFQDLRNIACERSGT
ncbi:MAG TPA: radical SAM protein [Desulfomonilaceae bacterium]|nr:radical SAM protein [Desulfomonilaceae bacterium]